MEVTIDITLIQKLLDSEVSGYEIAQQTGISQSVVSRARSQNIPVEELKFKNVMLLDQYVKNNHLN